MNLAKDFIEAEIKPPRCTTCKTLASLNASDREALQTAIRNTNLSIRTIVDVCFRNGITVNKNSIDAHRQGRCPKP